MTRTMLVPGPLLSKFATAEIHCDSIVPTLAVELQPVLCESYDPSMCVVSVSRLEVGLVLIDGVAVLVELRLWSFGHQRLMGHPIRWQQMDLCAGQRG